MINKEFKGEVKIAIGEFELFDEEVNNKNEAAEKCIKNGINTELKEIINDEAVEKKLESLTKNVKALQFATLAICNTFNLQHLQFATLLICNTRNLQHAQFATCAICNTCNLQHVQFATHAI